MESVPKNTFLTHNKFQLAYLQPFTSWSRTPCRPTKTVSLTRLWVRQCWALLLQGLSLGLAVSGPRGQSAQGILHPTHPDICAVPPPELWCLRPGAAFPENPQP